MERYIDGRVKLLYSADAHKLEKFLFGGEEREYGAASVMSNAFVPLRAIHAIRHADELLEKEPADLPKYRSFFEENLHIQLSYSSIPDSRFDPAELAFCLEGLLLAQPETVDRGIMSRVMDVLREAQVESAHWRPVKPILSNERGMALFPVSVEAANALIRSCELFDRTLLYDTFASACVDLFRRYWLWLKARTVRFHASVPKEGRTAFVGWHSEHVNDPNLLHIWETSQILEFLRNFQRLLKGHIAHTTLLRSRFSVRQPDSRKSGVAGSLDKVAGEYEAVTCMVPEFKVYRRVQDDFIEDCKAKSHAITQFCFMDFLERARQLWQKISRIISGSGV